MTRTVRLASEQIKRMEDNGQRINRQEKQADLPQMFVKGVNKVWRRLRLSSVDKQPEESTKK